MRGDDAAAFGHQGGEGAHDVAQRIEPAVGGDDADEIVDRLAVALTGEDGEGRLGRLVDVDQRAFEQPAEIRAGVDGAAQRLHLGHDGVELVDVVGVGVESGGIAIGEAAAGCDCRSA